MPAITIYARRGCRPSNMTARLLRHQNPVVKDISQCMEALAGAGKLITPIVQVRDSAGTLIDDWAGFRKAKIQQWARRED